MKERIIFCKKKKQLKYKSVKMEDYFSNTSLLKLVIKWKLQLGIVLVVSVVLAGVFSSPTFIAPKFKSATVIYPSNIAPYSDENEAEQMIQWLNSRDIKDSIIARFNLAEHYDISKDYKYYYTTILNEYGDNVSISKTQYESINIEIKDTDPQQAKEMVDAILSLLNKKIRRIHNRKYSEVLTINKKMLDKKNAEIDAVMAQLNILGSEYGIYDVESQAQEVARGYLGTVDGNRSMSHVNKKAVSILNKNLKEKGSEFTMLTQRIQELLNSLSLIEAEYDLSYKEYNKEFTYINQVTEPFVSDKKDYPVRWLIMFYAMVISMVFSILVIAFIENRKKFKLDK